MSERAAHVAVIGAGVAGLVAALALAGQGLRVTVVERATRPGGKMREVEIGGARLDAGPTVFTMRWVFEEIVAEAGASLDDLLALKPVEILARHAWEGGGRLDLFSDVGRSAEAIGAFAGPSEARRYRSFCVRAQRFYETLERPFIRSPRAGPLGLVRSAGLRGLGDLWRIRPFTSMWRELGRSFHDQRLRQLFGRFATYCGSSPFLAPATLMLVAHVERTGVWLVEGGMHRLARALADLAAHHGARFRYRAEASEILVRGGRVEGIRLASGEQILADAIVANADVAAIGSGRLGRAARGAVPRPRPAARSLSAVTWAMLAEVEGFPLLRHTVFFSDDYAAEFDDILRHKRLPSAPTVYVCAQDRDDSDDGVERGAERLLCLVNAPPAGDTAYFTESEIERCEERAFSLMQRCGLQIKRRPEASIVTTPADFEAMFPATGGALYGRATHGSMAAFRRPGSRSRLPGLYLAGGSVHPGPGVPMAALSGRLAAASLLADLASTNRSPRAAMPGGMPMR
jgi:1-hydroxycarotenoid 3,4-desaturase